MSILNKVLYTMHYFIFGFATIVFIVVIAYGIYMYRKNKKIKELLHSILYGINTLYVGFFVFLEGYLRTNTVKVISNSQEINLIMSVIGIVLLTTSSFILLKKLDDKEWWRDNIQKVSARRYKQILKRKETKWENSVLIQLEEMKTEKV